MYEERWLLLADDIVFGTAFRTFLFCFALLLLFIVARSLNENVSSGKFKKFLVKIIAITVITIGLAAITYRVTQLYIDFEKSIPRTPNISYLDKI